MLFWIAESLVILYVLINYLQNTLRRLVACLLVNNKLCRKLILLVCIMPGDNVRVTPSTIQWPSG